MRPILTIAFLLLASSASYALESTISESEIVFSAQNSNSITISISGPDGFNEKFQFDSSPAILKSDEINTGKDGAYNFEALSITKTGEEYTDGSNGRSGQMKDIVETSTTSGHFRLSSSGFAIANTADKE